MPELKMPQLNMCVLVGRLLRDPELKYGASGKAYLKTGVAIDDGFGERKKTYFLDIAYFGDPAEKIHPELSKGAPVLIEGRLTIDEWKDEHGGKRTRPVILCHRLSRLTWPEGDEYGATRPASAPTAKTPEIATEAPEDDIPF